MLRAIAVSFAVAFGVVTQADAGLVTFGSGENQFSMSFVEIGSAGNLADETGKPNPVGAVSYVYSIGVYEVSREMITKANAEAGLGITMANMDYVNGGVRSSMPATGIRWTEAATFVNYLNVSAGYAPAYKFSSTGEFELWQNGDIGFDSANPLRNSLANFVLPSTDELVDQVDLELKVATKLYSI